MKEQLINLSREKGFMNRDNLVTVYDSYYPLWMCELQKWLREVHKLIILIELNGGKDTFGFFIRNNHEEHRWVRTNDVYATYELALESALLEALNLIQTKP